jgi:hypothetical protein
VVAGALACSASGLAQTPLPTPKSARITMEALHAAGGVPPGWELALQPGDVKGGRQLFIEQGRSACHVVQGANLRGRPEARWTSLRRPAGGGGPGGPAPRTSLAMRAAAG